MSDTAKVIIGVLIGWLVIGTIAGLGYIAWKGPDQVFESQWDEEDQARRSWCADVRSELQPGHPFTSFQDVAKAALGGRLAAPTEPRPTTAEQLADWQDRNQAYLAASYLRQLEGFPRETTFAMAALDASLARAQDGQAIDDPELLREAARSLDDYLTRTC